MRHDLKECGKRIQQFRKEMHLSQEELAEKLNVSQNTIAKIECGLRRPSIDFLIELSMFFNTSMTYLVMGIYPEDIEKKSCQKRNWWSDWKDRSNDWKTVGEEGRTPTDEKRFIISLSKLP